MGDLTLGSVATLKLLTLELIKVAGQLQVDYASSM